MKALKHVRFHLSELVQALECYGKLHRPGVCEALDYYYNWAQARGWVFRAGFGYPVKGSKIWIGTGDRNAQLEIQEQEVLYEVVWSGEDTDGTCDFLEAFPVVSMVQRIIEVLEDRGWFMDADTDGYSRVFSWGKDGHEMRHISGEDIYRAALKLKPDGELDSVVEGIVENLEARA